MHNSIKNEYIKFLYNYENGDKIYVTVEKDDFLKYLKLFNNNTKSFINSTNAHTYRIWLFEGIIRFIVSLDQILSDVTITVTSAGMIEFGKMLIKDGYKLTNIFSY